MKLSSVYLIDRLMITYDEHDDNILVYSNAAWSGSHDLFADFWILFPYFSRRNCTCYIRYIVAKLW